jgi:hydrogenase expression/formation protein HypC
VCLAIPGRILEITLEQDLVFGQIEFDGQSRRVSLDLVPEAQVGDYVLVYAGFAMVIVQEAEAQSLLQILGEMSEMPRAPV